MAPPVPRVVPIELLSYAGTVLPRIALALGVCLVWAGLQLRYWEPSFRR